jgi:hypothetical protein
VAYATKYLNFAVPSGNRYIEKTPRKRPVWEKNRKSGTASLLVILFNNATAGGLNRE